MESILGAELFRREKNRIYINETEQLAVEYAKKILNSEQKMIDAIQTLERRKHTISIGSCAPVPNILLTATLEKHFLDIQIISEIATEQELLDGLLLSLQLNLEIGFTSSRENNVKPLFCRLIFKTIQELIGTAI